MLETGFAQIRFAASILFGTRFSLRSLDHLIASLQATQREFGFLRSEGRDLLVSPQLDEETRRAMQLRRFRSQAVRAVRETVYYQRLFERLGLDPGRVQSEEIAHLPLTPKADLRRDPEAFVCHTAHPSLRALTTGTTGWLTSVSFSAYELRVYAALTAISALFSGEITSEDIVQMSTSSRGTLGNVCLAGACAHIGALVYLAGVTEPDHALALLAEKHHLTGKKTRTSVLYTYPSYLGELIECGLARGYRPADFGLERIFVGGEVVTDGLKARCQQLFGAARVLESGYGMTEIWPFGGQLCEQGHLHFEVSQGLLEVSNVETAAPALAGETGIIVATPFRPYRETTLVLRYETGDVVNLLAEPLTCRMRHLPATSRLLGKLGISVRHECGWTYPRQIAEALEALEEVPLPARYGYWAVPLGVAVEVVVRQATLEARHRIETSLQERGVPIQALHLLEDRSQLRHPMPLRGDLREQVFGTLTMDRPLTSERVSPRRRKKCAKESHKMLHLSYYVVLGCVACVQVGSWAYFRRYQISSPPIGVFNVQDLAVMVLLIILVPLFYLILPLWLTAALLLLVATSILYFTWEPLLRARWAIWLATVTLLVVDSGAAFLGTKQNAFFAVNNIVLLVMGIGITNLWAQSGMKARDTALLGVLLALYDFIATVQLPLMGELVARLADLPLAPLVAWSSENTMPSIGLGDLLLATVFSLVMRKAFGRPAGLVALVLTLAAIGTLLALPLQGGFPLMVVLGPLMGLQYLYWRRRRGQERTTWHYLQEEPMQPLGERLYSQQEAH